MLFNAFSDLGGTPQNRRPKSLQKNQGCRPVWRSFWVPMYLSQDTFRGTEFQYFFGYLPGGPFGGFRLPRVPQRGRFWINFLTFGGPGALAEIAFSLTRNLHLARLGGPECSPGPSFFQGPFPGGSQGRPFPDFSDFRASPGIPWGPLLRSKPLPVVPETGHTKKVRFLKARRQRG